MKKLRIKWHNFLVKCLQPVFRKIIGWDELQEEVNTLHYLIDKSIDITEFPKADGVLRKVQLADAEVLRILNDVCEKHSLTYWLDWGTLLGAVRHKGFIPWDDDLDVTMPREDYDRASDILPGEMKKYGASTSVSERRICIMIWNAGINLDIFPADSVCENNSAKNNGEIGKKELVFSEGKYHNKDSIFPLKETEFEGHLLKVPNNTHEYLTAQYGDYMSFPKGGILHHKGAGSGIHMNSVRKGLDIDKFLEDLKSVTVD